MQQMLIKIFDIAIKIAVAHTLQKEKAQCFRKKKRKKQCKVK